MARNEPTLEREVPRVFDDAAFGRERLAKSDAAFLARMLRRISRHEAKSSVAEGDQMRRSRAAAGAVGRGDPRTGGPRHRGHAHERGRRGPRGPRVAIPNLSKGE